MKFCVRWARESDAGTVSKLRQQAYAESSHQIHDPRKLAWGPTDRCQRVLVLEASGILVSTARFEVIDQIEELEFKMQCRHADLVDTLGDGHRFAPAQFGLVSRAATAPFFREKGYYRLLQYFGLRYLAQRKVAMVLRSFSDDGSRLKGMRALGFEIGESTKAWDDFIAGYGRPCFGILTAEKIGSAIQKLRLQSVPFFDSLKIEIPELESVPGVVELG